jgi:o-succinylbenzoate---CoA ligase
VAKRSLQAVLVSGPADAGRLMAPLARALDGSGPAILPLDAGLPAARLRELLDAFAPDGIVDTSGVTTPRSGAKETAGDTAVIVGTSGSTGEPKGVELSAAALLHSARGSLDRIGARPGERWLCCLPVTHVAGIQVLVRSLVSGTGPVAAEPADPEAAGCAYVSLVPTQLRRLLHVDKPARRQAGTPLAGFGAVLLGGAAAPAGLLAAARDAGVRVITTYGMTETCGGCVYDGVPLDGVTVRAVDDGRLAIAGPVLFSRYRDRPDLTAAALSGGEFLTSDLGHVDKSGHVTVRGRADDVINTGGHKVVPGEVAAALESCPGVREAVVVGRPDPEWGERVTAIVVPDDPRDPPGLELLRTHVRARLPRYASPSEVVMAEDIPMLPSGKPDLARLRRA